MKYRRFNEPGKTKQRHHAGIARKYGTPAKCGRLEKLHGYSRRATVGDGAIQTHLQTDGLWRGCVNRRTGVFAGPVVCRFNVRTRNSHRDRMLLSTRWSQDTTDLPAYIAVLSPFVGPPTSKDRLSSSFFYVAKKQSNQTARDAERSPTLGRGPCVIGPTNAC